MSHLLQISHLYRESLKRERVIRCMIFCLREKCRMSVKQYVCVDVYRILVQFDSRVDVCVWGAWDRILIIDSIIMLLFLSSVKVFALEFEAFFACPSSKTKLLPINSESNLTFGYVFLHMSGHVSLS